jgi:adenylate cyclase
VGVLFADIVGFTTISETTPPEQVMALLRDFHSRMEEQVFLHHGTLEKFIGDALLATFGVPRAGARDATATLECVFGMRESLEQWNAARAAHGEPPIRIGIGAHYGPAVLGDIGSERSMAFAVVGDTVNTASRLQALTRDLGCNIVAADALIAAVRREAASREADAALRRLTNRGAQRLRGKEDPVEIWVA